VRSQLAITSASNNYVTFKNSFMLSNLSVRVRNCILQKIWCNACIAAAAATAMNTVCTTRSSTPIITTTTTITQILPHRIRNGQDDVSDGSSLASFHRGSDSILSQSIWGLWWIKWHRHRFFSEYFGFPLSVSFHYCSICIHSTITFGKLP